MFNACGRDEVFERSFEMRAILKKSQPAKEKTLASEAHDRLEEMIISGKLPARETISELMLSQQLGIGRTPIREALQKLRETNFVEILPRRGVVVTEVDFRDQLLLLEVRRDLERLLTRRTTRRATAAERTMFLKMAAAMRDCVARGDKQGLMKVDRQYKDVSNRIAANRYLTAALAPIHAHSRRFFFSKLQSTNLVIGEAHALIMDAISASDEAAAVRATDDFLDHMYKFTQEAISAELAK